MAVHKAGGVAVPLLARSGQRRAGPGAGSRRTERRHVQRATAQALEPSSPRARLGGDPVRRRLRAPADGGARRRGRHRLHLGDDRRAQGCGGPPRRPLLHRPGPEAVAGPRLPHLLTVRDDQRLPPRLRPHARRSERLVPAALRRRTLARPCQQPTVLWPRSWCRRWWSSSSPRRNSSKADLSSLAAVNVGSAPIAAGDVAAVRGSSRRRGPLRVRNDGVRSRQCHADGRRGQTSRFGGPPSPRGRSADRRRRTATRFRRTQSARSPWRSREPTLVLVRTRGTAERWQDGWLLSGDLGRLDGDGFLWIEGRVTETIVRGGHNVMPGEVEAALFEHPAVVEAAVAGIPHGVLGEDVAAWVVVRRRSRPRSSGRSCSRGWPTTRCRAGSRWWAPCRGTRAARSSESELVGRGCVASAKGTHDVSVHVRLHPVVPAGERSLEPASHRDRDPWDHRMVRGLSRPTTGRSTSSAPVAGELELPVAG